MTQEQTAAELGIHRRTIDEWEDNITSNVKIDKASIPPLDFRVKLSAEKREEVRGASVSVPLIRALMQGRDSKQTSKLARALQSGGGQDRGRGERELPRSWYSAAWTRARG
jgi:hypothetical protein